MAAAAAQGQEPNDDDEQPVNNSCGHTTPLRQRFAIILLKIRQAVELSSAHKCTMSALGLTTLRCTLQLQQPTLPGLNLPLLHSQRAEGREPVKLGNAN